MTTVLPARGDPPPEGSMAAAAEALRGGDIIAVPTDTVYGLAADPWHSGAVDRLFLLKGRPRSVELPLMVADADQALTLVTAVPASARRLMEAFWPGALTIVLPRREEVDADLGDEDATIGLRCPAHPVPRALSRLVGPFAATSANRHGDAPATSAQQVAATIPGVALVLDGGSCVSRPSTVVDSTGDTPRLLRPGAVEWDDILAAASVP